MKRGFLYFVSRIFLILISLGLALLFLEVIFRVFDIQHDAAKAGTWQKALTAREARLPGVRYQYRPHSEFYTQYDSNPNGYFDENNRLYFKMNNYGFRGDDIRMEKPKGTRRVIVLGDSFTLGDGVKVEDTFCVLMEKRLQQNIPKVEVLNFGMSGWNTGDQVNYLRAMGVQFQPDLVIIAFVLNDAAIELLPGDLMRNEFEEAYEKRRIKQSYFFTYVHTLLMRYKLGTRYMKDLVNSPKEREKEWSQSLARLSRGKKIAGDENSKFMVTIFPLFYDMTENYPFRPLHDLVRSHCEKNQIDVLDLLDVYQGERHTELWAHPTDHHPSPKAHRIAADAMAELILKNDLLQ